MTFFKDKTQRSKAVIDKEWAVLEKKEKHLREAAEKPCRPGLKEKAEKLLPGYVQDNLQAAFCKAFTIVFENGTGVIEKSYSREALQSDYEVQTYAFQRKADRKALKNIRNNTAGAARRNMAITTVEGIGLGVLGIGLPDIILFVAMLFKGIYETALACGFDYNTPEEKLFILKMMETAMKKGQEWEQGDRAVEYMMQNGITAVDSVKMDLQMQRTANAFAVDMLLLKFIQGLPLAGVLGGAANPVYYNRVMNYVQLKYQKRCLLQLKK